MPIPIYNSTSIRRIVFVRLLNYSHFINGMLNCESVRHMKWLSSDYAFLEWVYECSKRFLRLSILYFESTFEIVLLRYYLPATDALYIILFIGFIITVDFFTDLVDWRFINRSSPVHGMPNRLAYDRFLCEVHLTISPVCKRISTNVQEPLNNAIVIFSQLAAPSFSPAKFVSWKY